MSVPGKMEIIIKINQFPSDAQTVENGWKEFTVEVGGKEVRIKVKPKAFRKLEEAQASYPEWVAAIAGQMGAATPQGFILEQPNIQTFERKPKEANPESATTV